MHKLAIAVAAMLCCIGTSSYAEAPQGSLQVGSSKEVIKLRFGHNTGIATGNCLAVVAWANTAGTLCTTYTNVATPIGVVGIPKITRLVCEIYGTVASHAAGETLTLTPVWLQADGAGAFAATDASVTVVFNDGDDQLGDMIVQETDSTNSPYSGAQAMRLRADIAGGDGITTAPIVCEVVIESPI